MAAPAAAQPLHVDAERLRRIERELGGGPAPRRDPSRHQRLDAAQALERRRLRRGRARAARRDGVPSVVTVGPARDDRAFAEAVVAQAGGAAALAPATPSLADLAALFARSRLYVGSDTGPMHVASLVGTPVLQLLGPTDPVENAPWAGTPSRTLRVPVACSPCRRGCDSRALHAAPHPPTPSSRAALALLAAQGGGW